MNFHLPTLSDITESAMIRAIHYPITQNLIVMGAPGTGKTVVALHRFLELKKQGKNVLLLCFNKLLREFITKNVTEYSSSVKTMDSLFYPYKQMEDTFVRSQDRESLITAWEQHVAKYGKYDALIIDESQDLTKEILASLPTLASHITFLLDENQIIVARDGERQYIDMNILRSTFPDTPEVTLTRNFRNTKEIYEFAAQKFMEKSEIANDPNLTSASVSDPASIPTLIRRKESSSDQIREVINIIQHISQDQTIGILIGDPKLFGDISQELTKQNISHIDTSDETMKNSFGRIMLISQSRSKGLEFDTVIVIIQKNAMPEEKVNERLYVLSSRAKKRLFFIFNY